MARKAKSTKPAACEVCAGTELVRRITTYAVRLTGPLEGKQIHIGCGAPHECPTCEHLIPTPGRPGEVARNVHMGIRLFLGQLS
jgi:phage FluMu protein gp41